jgi:hypothetical protein
VQTIVAIARRRAVRMGSGIGCGARFH